MCVKTTRKFWLKLIRGFAAVKVCFLRHFKIFDEKAMKNLDLLFIKTCATVLENRRIYSY